jgi:hypothetical protein
MSLPLDGALAQCDRHASIMNEVLGLIPQPLTEAHLRHATPELIRLLDPLGLRSTALQDTLGTHVLRQFAVQTLAEPVKDAAFMDVLNLLERRGARMADRWALQRSMRNILTHGYPAPPCGRRWPCLLRRRVARQLVQWLRKIQERTKV